jgi:hypothetical protein
MEYLDRGGTLHLTAGGGGSFAIPGRLGMRASV